MLKRFKDDVKEVPAGQECGMAFANYQDLREGDEIECFQVETIKRSLSSRSRLLFRSRCERRSLRGGAACRGSPCSPGPFGAEAFLFEAAGLVPVRSR